MEFVILEASKILRAYEVSKRSLHNNTETQITLPVFPVANFTVNKVYRYKVLQILLLIPNWREKKRRVDWYFQLYLCTTIPISALADPVQPQQILANTGTSV